MTTTTEAKTTETTVPAEGPAELFQHRIDPDRLYSFSDARSLFPSRQHGKRLSLATIHRWFRNGKFPARRVAGGWFVLGADLIKLFDPPVSFARLELRTPAESQRAQAAAKRGLKRFGIGVESKPAPAKAAG